MRNPRREMLEDKTAANKDSDHDDSVMAVLPRGHSPQPSASSHYDLAGARRLRACGCADGEPDTAVP